MAVTLDDARMFQLHFNDLWVKANGILEHLYYFTRLEKWPHPKITGRVATLISYYSLGEINFVLLNFLGNLGILFTLLLFGKILDQRYKWFILLVLSILMFRVYDQNFWTILSFSFGYRLLFVGLSLYFLNTRKEWLSFVFSFFAVFSGGVGFVVFFVIGLYFLHELVIKRQWRAKYNVWALWTIMCLLLFYFGTLEGIDSTPSSINKNVTVTIFERLTSFITFVFSMSGQITDIITVINIPLIYSQIVGFVGISLFIYSVYKLDFKQHKHKVAAGMLIYMFVLILIAAILRDDISVIGEASEPRYLVYSIQFWVSLLLSLSLTYLKSDIWGIILLVIFILLMLNYSMTIFDRIELRKQVKIKKSQAFYNGILGDDVAPFLCAVAKDKRSKCVEYALYAAETGTYSFPSYVGFKKLQLYKDTLFMGQDKSRSKVNIFYHDGILKLRGSLQSKYVKDIIETGKIRMILSIGREQYLIEDVDLTYRKKAGVFEAFINFDSKEFDVRLIGAIRFEYGKKWTLLDIDEILTIE